MKKVLLFLFVLMVGCQKQTVKKDDADIHNAKNSIDYVGTYKGILPCADCEGLETEIAINENTTFSIKTKYLGKGNKIFVQKGNFTWNKKGNTIILTGVNEPNQYFVGENTLTKLDIYGKKITGSFAEEYILSKQPTDTSAIETAAANNDATVDLNSRIVTTTEIKKVNPAVGKYTLAETKWKLVLLNNKQIVQNGTKVYFLKLESKDARFTAFAGCNSIAGNYVMPSSGTIDFSEVMMTRMACEDMTLEDIFGAMLVQTKTFKLEKNTLTFFGDGKKVLSKFEAIK
ncbi:MAG: copper resistance protein NlpE N-terminal domain-containing protein [Bacteroidota bacterium]